MMQLASLAPLAVAPRLLAVSAEGHRTPARGSIPRVVEEGPATVAAGLQARPGAVEDRRERDLDELGQAATRSLVSCRPGDLQVGADGRPQPARRLVDDTERVFRRLLPFTVCDQEHPEGVAELVGATKTARPARARRDPLLLEPLSQILRRGQPLALVLQVDGVDERLDDVERSRSRLGDVVARHQLSLETPARFRHLP